MANVAGSKNAYVWMSEEGKIGDDFVGQLEFKDLDEIFTEDEEDIKKAETLSIIELMAKKAKSVKECVRMYVLYSKLGNKEKASYFLEEARRIGSIKDWDWVFNVYGIRAQYDKDCVNVAKLAKDMIKKEFDI